MEKRSLVIGSYDTARDGLWTLSALTLSTPEQQTYFVDVKGRDGPLDFSTAMTDGEPRYGSRILSATLESSEGTRAERHDRISAMMNALDGYRFDIYHPDYPLHYLSGRVKIAEEYNDPAHAAVAVTVTCDPWLYSRTARVYTVTATATPQVLALSNKGRRVVAPQLIVTGDSAAITIEYGASSRTLTAGTYDLVDLPVAPGNVVVTYYGTGAAKFAYREAVLR